MPSKPRVLLTEPVFDEVIGWLAEHTDLTTGMRGEFNSESALSGVIGEYDGLLSMLSNPVTENVLKKAKNLKIVANYAVGVNNIDVEACQKRGIKVANTPGVLTDATADGTLALMLSAVRNIPQAEKFLRDDKFDGWHPTGFLGMELRGRTLGIIGMGRIGRAVAARCRSFGMEIVYHNRNRLDSKLEKTLNARYISDPLELASVSDIVSLHCPLTDETHHIIDKRFLEKMGADSWLINAARGPVVDEAALADALHNKTIAGAGIDVFEHEPEIHPRLLSAPNAVLVPHITSATRTTRLKMGLLAAGGILNTLCGMDHECNFVV